MNVKANLIIEINFLNILEDLGRGDKVGNNIFITNNKKYKIEVISPIKRELEMAIGQLGYNLIQNSKTYIYSTFDYNPTISDSLDILSKIIAYIHGLLDVSWLVKDNSINLGLAYLLYISNGQVNVTQNQFMLRNFNVKGDLSEISFTREEFRKIRNLYRKHAKYDKSEEEPYRRIYNKNSDRLSRVFYFLHLARTTENIALKNVHYSSCFESLFSTDIHELAHQISERVAFFISTNPQQRHEIYHDVKTSYTLRSKVVHGSTLSENDFGKLIELTMKVDEYLRICINEVLKNPIFKDILSDSKNIDEYFHKLIFGEG